MTPEALLVQVLVQIKTIAIKWQQTPHQYQYNTIHPVGGVDLSDHTDTLTKHAEVA